MTARLPAALAAGVLLAVGCTGAKPHPRVAPPAHSASVATPVATGPPSPAATARTPRPAPSAGSGAPSTSATSPAATASAPAAGALAAYYGQHLAWEPCGGPFSCAHATVPLDYADPSGKRIAIAMIKLPAGRPEKRIGSLFINPGGPGGSGIQYARYARSVIPAPVRDRFDIIGFDPRGVGSSSPVRCATGAQLDQWLAVDPSPDNAAELQQFVAMAKAFAAGCRQRSGALLPFISTRNSARDMDVMRAAVGDAKLSYLGKSYGTYLGALYADLFPNRVRALILDGAVDPTADTQTLARVQARGFEVALSAFLAHCAKSSACAFGRLPDIDGRFRALLAGVERQPLATSSGRTVGPDEASLGVAEALYSRQAWPSLEFALAQAQRGDGSTLLALFDEYVHRDDRGHYDNLIEAYTAIGCLDRPSPLDLATYQADARRFLAESPHFGDEFALAGLPCAYWPVPAVGPAVALRAAGAAPILVIGTTRDPATPLVWAQRLSSQLESGRLLTFDGDGHTAYGDGDPCVDNAGNDYLTALKLPPNGKLCG